MNSTVVSRATSLLTCNNVDAASLPGTVLHCVSDCIGGMVDIDYGALRSCELTLEDAELAGTTGSPITV